MCCEPIWTASGQTCWVVMEVTCPGFYGILLCYQTPAPGWTRTLAREEQCTLGKLLDEKIRDVGEELPPPLSAGTRCRLFHVVHVDLRGRKTFHHRPFVSQPCRTLGLSRGSRCWFDFQHGVGSSRLQHICVFSHQCVIVQYDGCLMLKQDRYITI